MEKAVAMVLATAVAKAAETVAAVAVVTAGASSAAMVVAMAVVVAEAMDAVTVAEAAGVHCAAIATGVGAREAVVVAAWDHMGNPGHVGRDIRTGLRSLRRLH